MESRATASGPGRGEARPRRRLLTWFAFAGSAVAFVIHFLVGYFYAEATCATGEGESLIEPLVLWLTAGLGLVAVASGVAGWFLWRGAGRGEIFDPRGRLAFMGFAGMVAAAVFLFAIITEGIQVLDLTCAPS